MAGGPTERQRDLLDYIHRARRDRDALPSLRELAGHLGVTPMAIVAHLDALAAKGLLVRLPRRRPSYALPPADHEPLPRAHITLLPLYGSIAAGEPLEPLDGPPQE